LQDDAGDSTSIRVQYSMAVEHHEQGRLIRYSDFSGPDLSGVSQPEQQLLQLLSSVVPSYVVSDAGELVAVHGLDSIRATLEGWLDPLLDSLPAGEFRDLLHQMISEQTLFALAAQEWNALVGTWVGAELEVGAAYELQADEPLPMLGNVLVPFRYELGASGRVPCHPEATTPDCVELIIRSYPDPEQLQAHLEAFLRRMVEAAGPDAGVPPLTYDDLALETEVVLVARPEDLVPFSLSSYRSVEVSMDVGGEQHTARDYQLAEYTFRHR
jgi:hypothetical protein